MESECPVPPCWNLLGAHEQNGGEGKSTTLLPPVTAGYCDLQGGTCQHHRVMQGSAFWVFLVASGLPGQTVNPQAGPFGFCPSPVGRSGAWDMAPRHIHTPRSHPASQPRGRYSYPHPTGEKTGGPDVVLGLTGSSPELGPEARGSQDNRIMEWGWRALNSPRPRQVEGRDGDPGDSTFKVPRSFWCAATGKNGH